jgi:hypothetical protein
MSELTYFAIQFVILLAYGCYVSYKAGYSKGFERAQNELL